VKNFKTRKRRCLGESKTSYDIEISQNNFGVFVHRKVTVVARIEFGKGTDC